MTLTTMYPAKANSPSTTLAADIEVETGSIILVDASVLPQGPNFATLGTDENAEVVFYESITENTLNNVLRGQSGTSAKSWSQDTPVARYFTSYDYEAFRSNIQGLATDMGGKQDTYAQSASAWDTTPSPNSTNPVTSGGIKIYADQKILYFYQQNTSQQSSASGEFCRVTDSRIDGNTVVLNCTFTVPSAITSDVSWISDTGYISLKGICTSTTCKVNLVLGQKGN